MDVNVKGRAELWPCSRLEAFPNRCLIVGDSQVDGDGTEGKEAVAVHRLEDDGVGSSVWERKCWLPLEVDGASTRGGESDLSQDKVAASCAWDGRGSGRGSAWVLDTKSSRVHYSVVRTSSVDNDDTDLGIRDGRQQRNTPSTNGTRSSHYVDGRGTSTTVDHRRRTRGRDGDNDVTRSSVEAVSGPDYVSPSGGTGQTSGQCEADVTVGSESGAARYVGPGSSVEVLGSGDWGTGGVGDRDLGLTVLGLSAADSHVGDI